MELRKMLPEFLQEYLVGLTNLLSSILPVSGNIEESTHLITSLKYFSNTITENCPIDFGYHVLLYTVSWFGSN
jgi:hypothetical protein